MKDGWLIQLYPNEDFKKKLQHIIEKEEKSHLCKKRVRDEKEDDKSLDPSISKKIKLDDYKNDNKIIESHVLKSLFNNKDNESVTK